MDECLTILQVIDNKLPLIMDNCRILLKEKEQEFYKRKKVKSTLNNVTEEEINNIEKKDSNTQEKKISQKSSQCDMLIDDIEDNEDQYETVVNKNVVLKENDQ